MRLVGWTNIDTGEVKSPYGNLDAGKYRRLAFAGIHYMNPSLFRYFPLWGDRFSVIDFYLSVCDKETIYGYVQEGLKLMDVGKIGCMDSAEEFLKECSS